MRTRLLNCTLALLLAAAASVLVAASPAPFAEFDRKVAIAKEAMMGHPARALMFARQAEALAGSLPASLRADLAMATAQWLEGESLIFLNNAEAAAPVINAALTTAERLAPNSKLYGDTLRSRGAIFAMTGRSLDALRDYQRAHDVFQRAGELRSRALSLQDISSIYYDAGDFSRVLDYSRQAEEAFPGDPMLTLTSRNNRGEVYRKQKRYRLAAIEYRGALVQARKLGSSLLQARLFTNLASSEAEAGRFSNAQAAVNEAARLAVRGEAAGWRPFVYGSAAEIAAGRRDFDRAARLLGKTFLGVDLNNSDMLFRDYHHLAARVFEKKGESALALRHLKAFQRLDAEGRSLTSSAASQLIAARFDFANQNLKISKLKQDQLRLEIQAERDKSHVRSLLFSGLGIFGAFALGVLLFGLLAVRRSRDAVAAANNRLRGLNDQLQKALKARTDFLATTSHEIRTPLNGILGMTQVMLAERGVEPSMRERIKLVHGAGETMKALVDDILDVAKMESGEFTVADDPCDLLAILYDAARLWSGQATAKGLSLVLEVEGAPSRIKSDGPRLRQIVFNLMSNALKFTSEGTVTLHASAGPLIGQAFNGEALILRVTDTGVGIPADKQGEIFEPFKQVEVGVTRQFGGSGLGLAICKKLAIALGGDISVFSVPGQGTTFTLAVPLRRAEGEDTDLDLAEPVRALEGARVMLLDRNPSTQIVMRGLLVGEGAIVAVADTAAHAIAALNGPADATHLVVDTSSLGEHGVNLVGLMRDLARAARTAGAHSTLLLSTDAAEVTIGDAMTAGASQLVVKPISTTDLIRALRSLYGDDPEPFVAPELLDPLSRPMLE